MVENCTLYLPDENVLWKELFPGGKSNRGIFRKATQFQFPSDYGIVKLNMRSGHEIGDHLEGFKGYVSQLDNRETYKRRALNLIDRVRLVLGVEFPAPIPEDSEVFHRLVQLADETEGFLFMANSILIPKEGFIVGPMSSPGPAMASVTTVKLPEEERREHEQRRQTTPPHLLAVRDENLAELRHRGFACNQSLPLPTTHQLRPAIEIGTRLCALAAIFAYASHTGIDSIPAATIRNFFETNGLAGVLTEDESNVYQLPRFKANEQFGDTIGWRLENMWALAWVLGFEPEPSHYTGQLPDEVIRKLFEFLPSFDAAASGFLNGITLRPDAEVVAKEDLFYCAHNAVRSAQLDRSSVPVGFDPVIDGGAIHERRQSLTWCLSPGVAWDDTDLST